MFVSLNLLLIARSRQALQPVMIALEGQQVLELTPYILNPGQILLPEYLRPMPEGLIFVVDEEWRQGIWETIDRIPTPRPAIFIITSANDMETLRLAMRYGVRDVFSMPLEVDDFTKTVLKVVHEERQRSGQGGRVSSPS